MNSLNISAQDLNDLMRSIMIYNFPIETHYDSMIADTVFLVVPSKWIENFKKMDGFISTDIYPEHIKLLEGEVGQLNNWKIIENNKLNNLKICFSPKDIF